MGDFMKGIGIFCFSLLLCALSGCGKARPASIECGRPRPTAVAPDPTAVNLHLDYAGAEAIIRALEQDSLSNADVDALLRVHGARAMVDNVTRFIPRLGVPQFRSEIRTFARTKRTGEHEEFQLLHTWDERSQVRELIRAIRADESRIIRETLSLLEPYRGDTGPLSIKVYFTAGGVSNGFVFDDPREPALYANLTRAGGDLNDVVGNLAHEAYHVMQKAAQRRAGLGAVADSTAALPKGERLLAVTLAEGVANYVVDPTCSPSIRSKQSDESVDRYLRNAKPRRIKKNFALFDEVLADLGAGRIAWEEAYERGFTGADPHFYFVGYEMAKAIERHCGTPCIPRLFQQPPVEFFRQYIALYRKHPEIQWRFAPATERYLKSLR
jgi:hypothetical protein